MPVEGGGLLAGAVVGFVSGVLAEEAEEATTATGEEGGRIGSAEDVGTVGA